MDKTKNQKKKNTNKLAIKAIKKQINSKKKTIKNINNNNNNLYKNKSLNTKKSQTKYQVKKLNKPISKKKIEEIIINDKELEKLDIPVIKKEKIKKIEQTNKEITKEDLEKKIEKKIDEKIEQKIKEKIDEKLNDKNNNTTIIEKNEEKIKENSSRKLAKKEDVFSKVMDWFKNLSIDNNNYRKRKVTNIQKYDKKNKKIKKIKNKEIEDTKKYPKNKLLKALAIIHENLYIPFDTIIIFSFIILIIGMYRVQVIPSATIKYIACIVGFLSIVAISLNKYISGRIFTIIITAGMLGGIYYLNNTYDFINNLNTKLYEYQEYYLIALDNGRNKSIYNINNKKVGLLEDNSRNVTHVLNTKLDHITYIKYTNQDKLYEEFFNNETRAIIVKENQYKYIQNNNKIDNIKVKILYKFNVNTKK